MVILESILSQKGFIPKFSAMMLQVKPSFIFDNVLAHLIVQKPTHKNFAAIYTPSTSCQMLQVFSSDQKVFNE